MNSVRQFIASLRASFYMGRGYRSTRRKEFGRAMDYYQRARECESRVGEGPTPHTTECIAWAHYRLGAIDTALAEARAAMVQYEQMNCDGPVFHTSRERVGKLIGYLQSENQRQLHSECFSETPPRDNWEAKQPNQAL